ncbi:MAG: hypothetical protein JKY56_03155 [Kofleriaceae bacterium]|nr:hypothetical protein [Kofleriaceae bacterium]
MKLAHQFSSVPLPVLPVLLLLLSNCGATGGGGDIDVDSGGASIDSGSIVADAAQDSPDAETSNPDAGTVTDIDAGMVTDIDAGTVINIDAGTTTTAELTFEPIYGLVNADDDDSADGPDWFQAPFTADNDFSTLDLPFFPGHSIEFTLTGDVGSIRVWNDSDQVILGDNFDAATITTTTVAADGTTLRIEFGYYLVHGLMQARLIDGSSEVDSQSFDMWSSPMILNHHLQPSEHLYVVNTPNGSANNVDMVAGYRSVLSANEMTEVASSSVNSDPWMQDEHEFAHSTGSQGQRITTVIDSIRNRGLDVLSSSIFRGPGFYSSTWGPDVDGAANSYDSFGNLEVSPPVNVGGIEYPFGRVYYGDVGNQGPNGELGAFIASQKVQAPFTVNTSWLCVGHIDEVSSWIADPSSTLGYKFLIADVTAGFTFLDSLASNIQLPLYSSHGFDTSGDMQNDIAFRNENMDIQDDYLTPMLATFMAETGITESDVIRVPAFFENVGCGMAALMPGTVNLIVADGQDNQTHLFLPDPFFRDVFDQSVDPFIAHFDSLFPSGTLTHYLDDWFSYHELLGEVHCGTNVERTPLSNWWESAMHLAESN